MAATRLTKPPEPMSSVAWLCTLIAAAYAPDLDVVGVALGVPYGAPFGHRGALHSLVVASAIALLGGLVASRFGVRPLRFMVVLWLVTASHGLLDSLTDGGKGVALLWPFTSERYFASWRPLPVSPLGFRVFSFWGWRVIFNEALLFLPLFLLAIWPPREAAGARGSGPTMD
jgi:inner membrane protein